MTQGSWILSLLWIFPAASQDAGKKVDEKTVKALIEKLDSDLVDVRGQAENELKLMDEAIVPLLEKANLGASVESRARLDRVIGELTLARRWVKDLSGEETDALQAFARLDHSIRTKSLDRRQAVRILSAAILSFDISKTLRPNLLSVAERNQLGEIWPALIELLGRGDQEANNAFNTLQRIKLPEEATDEILKALPRAKGRNNVVPILELLSRLKPDRAKTDGVIQGLIDEADDSGVFTITSYISNGRLTVSLKTALKCWNGKNRSVRQSVGREAVLRIPPDESVKDIIDGLASADAEDVGLSAEYVARHRVRQAAAQVFEALQKHSADERARRDLLAGFAGIRRPYVPYDPTQSRTRLVAAFRSLGPEELIKEWLRAGGPPSRLALVGMIAELDLRPLAGEVVAALGDQDAQVRQAAARALFALPHPEAAARLEALLKDESVPVRRAALQSLAAVRGQAATAIVLEQLRSDKPDVQAMAVEVLPAMNLDLVLDDLTRESSLGGAMTRYALAALVAYHGDSLLHRVMARTAGKLSAEELQSMVRLIQSARGLR